MSTICKNIVKEFGDPPTRIIHDISLTIEDGDFIAISGRSGSGKSTLLYLFSTLDLPTSGSLFIDNRNITDLDVTALHNFRNIEIGFVFQFHYLLSELNALENVLLPARKTLSTYRKNRLGNIAFQTVRIANKVDKLSSQLSGGEQQRVAIIRVLIVEPKYFFLQINPQII